MFNENLAYDLDRSYLHICLFQGFNNVLSKDTPYGVHSIYPENVFMMLEFKVLRYLSNCQEFQHLLFTHFQ